MGVLHDKSVTARHLEDSAQDPALAPRSGELRALAAAMTSHDDSALDAWADLDLMAHFARPESVARAEAPAEGRHTKWLSETVDRLDWLLGALVFLPLLFTWTGLAMATSAYGDLTAQNPKAAARPFLQLWQTGFEGHLHSWFQFGHVAVFGCVALLALLTLTLLHGNRRAAADRAEEKAEQDTRAALARLVPVLTEAQLILNAHRFASPARFAEELNKAGGKIQRMHSKALSTQEQLADAAEAMRETLLKAEQRLSEADAEVRPLQEAVSRMADTVRHTGTEIRAAVKELDQPLAHVGDRLADVIDGHGVVLDRARDGLLTAADDLRENVRAATEELRDGVRAATGELGDTLRSVTDELRAVLTRTTDRLETSVTGNGDEVRTALTDAAQRVEDAVTMLAASQRGFTSSVEVTADLNGRLIDALDKAAHRAEAAADASGSAVSDIVDRTRSLDTAATRFADVVDALERAAEENQALRAAAEEDRRRAEEAQRRTDENRRRAEDARRKSEDALRKAEELALKAQSPTPPAWTPPAPSGSGPDAGPGGHPDARPHPQPRSNPEARPEAQPVSMEKTPKPVSLEKVS